jgi:hypothetical protein
LLPLSPMPADSRRYQDRRSLRAPRSEPFGVPRELQAGWPKPDTILSMPQPDVRYESPPLLQELNSRGRSVHYRLQAISDQARHEFADIEAVHIHRAVPA